MATQPGWILVAAGPKTFQKSLGCGMCLEIQGSGQGSGNNPIVGKRKAVIVDYCAAGCGSNGVDFFIPGDGRWTISYVAVDCPTLPGRHGKIHLRFQGSNTWYIKLQTRNTKVPTAGIEVLVRGKYYCLTRVNDNFFIGMGLGRLSIPLRVRLTAITGEQLHASVPAIKNDVSFASEVQYQGINGAMFEHNNHIYKFVFPEDDKRTWYEAESLCQTLEDGHLTSLVSPNEITWVDSIITNIARDSGSKVKLWIGGSDRKFKDVWDFVDEKPLRYNVVPWAPGQPRRPNQQATYAYCVSLEFAGDRSTWYVEDCYKTHGYICKADGWEWEQHVYKFIPLQWNALSWTEAEIYCKEIEGGHLLSIRNPKENRWVTERIRQIRWVVGFSKLWIGASDIGHEGNFQWSDDKRNRPVNFTR
ncbi:C-type mannose receptor 2 [Acropora cervicornis]|uniref:C-type mannose receptor 2 n=1 Tax=Acropora cervicornis TaxID=6130 RepID=A0AAD9QUB3_ACRCE|nr:C-type mannose receptor 2 [Acropora cervicornis]